MSPIPIRRDASEQAASLGDLDAVIAAPGHHLILLENSSVRVLETKIEPGAKVNLHTHRWPAVSYVLSIGDYVRRDENGAVLSDSRLTPRGADAGQAVWTPPLGPHTVENVGTTPIHVISVEIKDAANP